ncbi:MAG TPA: phage holin family protein [Microlunatus sp.]|nr:phage holin family protein [Microlunatus sp.]
MTDPTQPRTHVATTNVRTEPPPETIGGAVSELTRDLSTLMHQEVALAKAEVRQSASEAGRGIGLLVGAAIAALLFLVFVSIAVWWAIGNESGRGWAGLIVAVIWLIVGVILFAVGRKQLQQTKGLPKTADSLAKVPNALKGNEEENR